MFSTTIKRSVATLGVVAGLFAVAGPANVAQADLHTSTGEDVPSVDLTAELMDSNPTDNASYHGRADGQVRGRELRLHVALVSNIAQPTFDWDILATVQGCGQPPGAGLLIDAGYPQGGSLDFRLRTNLSSSDRSKLLAARSLRTIRNGVEVACGSTLS